MLTIKHLDVYFQSKNKEKLQEFNLFKRTSTHNAIQLEGMKKYGEFNAR